MYFMPAERTCDGVNCEDVPNVRENRVRR
jgi:hypothetical protein